jgi:hypothetical protein
VKRGKRKCNYLSFKNWHSEIYLPRANRSEWRDLLEILLSRSKERGKEARSK